MFLSPSELELFYSEINNFNTKKLNELEYFLRYNNKCTTYKQMHRIVEMILIKRSEYSFLNLRDEQINYLDKCFSLSNPFGRFSARLIGYISNFTNKGKITKTIFFINSKLEQLKG